jgi:hypothetical protein
MKHTQLLKEMKDSIGVQEPVVYFDKMTQLLGLLFDRLDQLEAQVYYLKTQSALAIQWEPRVAADMLVKQINELRDADEATYAVEIAALKVAYAEDRVTQEYASFCQFWLDTLGYHPFLDYTD